MFITFGVGIMRGAYWGGCCRGFGWGWGCHWGGGHNTIIINNHFHSRYNYRNVNVGNRVGNGNQWNHNGSHRGPVPYSNRAAAQKYGGMTRDAKGNVQRFDRPSTPSTRPSTRPDARPSTRPSTPIATRDRTRDSALGGMETRDRAKASSDRGFSSARPSTRPSARPAPSSRPAPSARPAPRPAPRGGR